MALVLLNSWFMTRRFALGSALWLASCLGLAACGGSATRGGGNQGGAPSGGTGGEGGAAGRKNCVVGGKTYADGATFTNGCNGCSCNDGEVTCDLRDCVDGCIYAGKGYAPGESFPATDGCNTCSCESGGVVSCTEIGCFSCQDAQTRYAAAVDEARKCDPKAMDPCRGYLVVGLQCTCGIFVNEANVEALASAKQAAAQYSEFSCEGPPLPCPSCPPGIAGYCSPAGLCETVWEHDPSACKVGGVVYPDGATQIPDPTSCNKCTCKDGELTSCTEVGCPKPCPADRVLSTQCALCGPTDECLIVEHACLPTCDADTDSCAEGLCVDGVCRKICG